MAEGTWKIWLSWKVLRVKHIIWYTLPLCWESNISYDTQYISSAWSEQTRITCQTQRSNHLSTEPCCSILWPTLTGRVLLITHPCRGEVGVSGQLLTAAGQFTEGDGHLSRLEVQQTCLVDHMTQQFWEVGGTAYQLEFCTPDVGRHLNQLAALEKKQREHWWQIVTKLLHV